MNFSEISKRLWPYLYFSVVLYFSFAAAGVFFASSNEEWSRKLIEQIADQLGPLFDENMLILAVNIFLHNAIIQFVLIITFFVFGIFPIIALASNGIALGALLYLFSTQQGVLKSLAAIIPHGLVELPSFFIASAVGLWLGVGLFKKITKKERFGKKFTAGIKIYLFILLPLTLFAAFIETFVTPLVYVLFE